MSERNGSRLLRLNPSAGVWTSAGLGSALAVITVFAAREFAGVEIPGEVSAALGTVYGAAIMYFFPGGKRSDNAQHTKP